MVTRDGISRDEAKALSAAAREIHDLDALFTPYVSPQVAERLRADPTLAELGGVERQVSVLFADLQGFTAFSETRSPAQVIGMLNRYWSAAVPAVTREDGFIERFAGDAIMVVFNAAGNQPDHARRAVRAGLGLQRAAAGIALDDAWPRFRVGINSGQAVVGNVGTAEHRCSPRSGTRRTSPPGSRAWPVPGRWSSARPPGSCSTTTRRSRRSARSR